MQVPRMVCRVITNPEIDRFVVSCAVKQTLSSGAHSSASYDEADGEGGLITLEPV